MSTVINLVNNSIISSALASIKSQAAAIQQLENSIDQNFEKAVKAILNCKGRIIICGMGKSGHIGKKIAATMASTGTPAMFVHPAEASHGDLGMIEKRDVVIAISRSGESPELADIIAYCRRFEITLIGMTAKAGSTLGSSSNILLKLPDIPEACPMGLAPTNSTTMTLVLGDALAIACLTERDFAAENFRIFHPGGKLGQKLTKIKDIMHTGEELPVVSSDSDIKTAIFEMTRCRFGCVGVTDNNGKLVGIFTDGDLRRNFDQLNFNSSVKEVMSSNPSSINPTDMVADVANLFNDKRITSVFACENGKPVGIIHIHDFLERGYV